MPELRLQKTRENNRCDMCDRDALVGTHTRTVSADGTIRESCPTRVYVTHPSQPIDHRIAQA